MQWHIAMCNAAASCIECANKIWYLHLTRYHRFEIIMSVIPCQQQIVQVKFFHAAQCQYTTSYQRFANGLFVKSNSKVLHFSKNQITADHWDRRTIYSISLHYLGALLIIKTWAWLGIKKSKIQLMTRTTTVHGMWMCAQSRVLYSTLKGNFPHPSQFQFS